MRVIKSLPIIWETGSLDASVGIRDADHEMQNVNINSTYEPQLLLIDRLLESAASSDKKEKEKAAVAVPSFQFAP